MEGAEGEEGAGEGRAFGVVEVGGRVGGGDALLAEAIELAANLEHGTTSARRLHNALFFP